MVKRKDSAEQQRLARYRSKRDPAGTTEPFSAERKDTTGSTLSGDFVVHLHAATRRHYDLRLQIGNALMSFAVPRGPSLNPEDKRLAVNTEDHPIEYVEFEDVIPPGQYGAGAMIVWDTGRVRYLEGSAEDGIARGKIDFQLAGHKLKGRFGLIHTGARAKDKADKNHWLLVKKTDGFSRGEGDITEQQPHSVLSGLTVDQLEHARDIAVELETRAAELGAERAQLDAGKLQPMLCASKGASLVDAERIYELKLDGVRIVADKRGEQVDLRYRKLRSARATYPEITRALRALAPERVVLDGEIVAFDDAGRPSFERLARRIHLSRPTDVRRAASEVPIVYMVFDLLQLGDHDLRTLPLSSRKQLLAELLPGKGLVRMLDHIDSDGTRLFQFCQEHQLEGVVAKLRASRYRPGPKRFSDWVKIKCEREDDFVVVGWEHSDKARKLRNLVLASVVDDELVLRGKVGSGLDDASIDWFIERLRASEVDAPTASGTLREQGKRHWVEPRIVVSIQHGGFSTRGHIRFPVFRGVCVDRAPSDCGVMPSEERVERAMDHSADGPREPGYARAKDVATKVALTNQDKIFWPTEGYTKGDLCDYYASVAEVMLPLVADRPVVLVRYPDGIDGKSFFQWNVPRGTPSWLRSFEMRMDGERGKGAKRTFLLDDVDGLLHVANLGCIPIHILASRQGRQDMCDFLTIDLDLGDNPFRHAVTLSLSLREMLADLGLSGMPKTSGQSGLHVLIPMGDQVPFPTAKALVELLGRLLQARHDDIATVDRRVDRRGGRVYIDTGQTGRSRTIVAPYSVRAYRGARVSTPLSWDEIHMALDPGRLDMFTVPGRIASGGDPMRELLQQRPDVPAAVAKLEKWVRA